MFQYVLFFVPSDLCGFSIGVLGTKASSRHHCICIAIHYSCMEDRNCQNLK